MRIKMQHDKYTDFDLELRSMLQDAEEDVPSRVWESLSGELDRRDRSKVVTLWWRRAAVGFSVAAAVLAGFVIFHGRSADELGVQAVPSDIVAESANAHTDSPEDVATIEEQIASSAPVMLAEVPVSRPQRVQGTVPAEAVSFEEAVTSPVQETVETEEAAVSEPAPAVSPSARDHSTNTTEEEEPWTDPFAQMAYEDAHAGRHRGASLSIDGSAATNDRNPGGILPNRKPASSSSTGVTEKSSSTFGVPMSFGLGLKLPLSGQFSLGTGVTYSLLTRSFTGIYNSSDGLHSVNSDIYNELHYIGVPLNLYFDIITSPDLKFYVWGGGSIEKGLLNKYRIYNKPDNIILRNGVDGVQFSTAAGLGLEFALSDYLGLYIDPSVRYYFDCKQPASVRTMKPFMMNFELGLRFSLR